MAEPNPHRPFVPDPEQARLTPAISGNVINGLGETIPRRPRMVYWAPDTNDIPHGPLQEYFYRQSAREPAFAERRAGRQALLDEPLPEVATTPANRAPQNWTDALSGFVETGDCEQTGVAEMHADWVYEGQNVEFARIVMLGVAHDHDRLRVAPAAGAGLEVMTQYTRAAAVARKVAGWIRSLGWDAEPVTGPLTGALTLIPPALACGFGELGKHGSVINPKYGSAFRLAAVLTNAPFSPTPAREHGIDGFCQNCRICENACPPEALSPDKRTVRGITRWYVDFDRCLPFFNQTHGCAICIAVCPWSRPGVGLNLAAKLARRAARSG